MELQASELNIISIYSMIRILMIFILLIFIFIWIKHYNQYKKCQDMNEKEKLSKKRNKWSVAIVIITLLTVIYDIMVRLSHYEGIIMLKK